MKKIINVLGLSLLALSINTFAKSDVAPKQSINDKPVPESIQIAKKNGIDIIERFETSTGFDGWVVKNKRDHNIWYSNDAGYVFVGALLDPKGKNLTAQYFKEKVPKKDYQSIIDSLTVVKANPDVESDMPIYVFYEPFCGYCSAVHAQLVPYIERGADVRWVPIGFLRDGRHKAKDGKATSEEVVARILSSENPLQLIESHESDKAVNGGKGGLTEGVAPTPEVLAKMRLNKSIFNEFGFTGTPATFYVDSSGELKKLPGAALFDKWAGLFGMPRMDSTDKRLTNLGAQPYKYPVK